MVWNILKAGYSDFITMANTTYGVFIKSDGLKMYTTNRLGHIREHALSTAWVISTSSFVRTIDITAQTNLAYGVSFNLDGSKMYVCGSDIFEYALSTPWNISSAVHSVTLSVENNSALFFKDDGTMFYIAQVMGANIYGYKCSTAWDITGATLIQTKDTVSDVTGGSATHGIFITPDGEKMFISSHLDGIIEYNLENPWTISTATYVQTYDIETQCDIVPYGLFFRPNGISMYVSTIIGSYSIEGYEMPSSKRPPIRSS